MRLSRRPCLALFLALSLTAAMLAAAEEPNEPLDTGHEEAVSVTASRTPIPVDETGNSISILTREDIEARGHPFVADLLRGLPGLSVSRSGPLGSQTQLRVRGAEANHVLVQIDGVDVSDVFAADELPFELMTSYDIQRIEFVRGPQSGLWGSEAVAGVINIITDADVEPGGSAELEAGSFDALRAGGRYAMASESLRFNASVSHLDADGTNVARQGSEDDGTRNTTASAALNWNPADEPFSLRISARHTDATSDFDDIDFITTGLPIDAINETETDLTVVQATGRWAAEASRWNHRLTLSSTDSEADTQLSGAAAGSNAIDKLGASFQSSVDLSREGSKWGHSLALAVDHEQRDFSQRGPASPFGDPNQDQDVDNTGLAVEYRFRARDRWAASASVRYENNSDFDDSTTFRVTGSLGFSEGRTRLRAAAGTGQKAPTFIERFGFFSATFVGNPNLEPEESTSFEVGVDRQIGRRSDLALTYFNDTLENEINGFFFDATAGALTAVNEDGDSDRQGVELAFSTSLGARFGVRGSYTYIDATQPSAGGGDERELRRPKQMASLSANWRSAGNRFKIHGSLNHTGSQIDLFFPPFPLPSQRVELDSYLLADANLSFTVNRRIELFGRVENLLDEEYEDVFGFRASGIGAYAGVRFRTGTR